MGIAATIAGAREAREPLRVALQPCETSTDADSRVVGTLSADDHRDRICRFPPAAAPAT